MDEQSRWEKLLEWLSEQGFGQYVQENIPEGPSDFLSGKPSEQIAREDYGPTTEVDPAAILAEKQAEMAARTPYVPKVVADKPKEDTELDDFYSQLFMQSLVENLSGGKPGQAPGVVLGGRSSGLPTMMKQFNRQRKPWWIV